MIANILNTISLSDLGLSGIVVSVVYSILRGKLHTNSEYKEITRQRDHFEDAYRYEYETRLKAEAKYERLLNAYLPVANTILQSLPTQPDEAE